MKLTKHLVEGVIVGILLAIIMYVIGTIALNATPAAFPVGFDVMMAAIGFIAPIALAYGNAIEKDKTEK